MHSQTDAQNLNHTCKWNVLNNLTLNKFAWVINKHMWNHVLDNNPETVVHEAWETRIRRHILMRTWRILHHVSCTRVKNTNRPKIKNATSIIHSHLLLSKIDRKTKAWDRFIVYHQQRSTAEIPCYDIDVKWFKMKSLQD